MARHAQGRSWLIERPGCHGTWPSRVVSRATSCRLRCKRRLASNRANNASSSVMRLSLAAPAAHTATRRNHLPHLETSPTGRPGKASAVGTVPSSHHAHRAERGQERQRSSTAGRWFGTPDPQLAADKVDVRDVDGFPAGTTHHPPPTTHCSSSALGSAVVAVVMGLPSVSNPLGRRRASGRQDIDQAASQALIRSCPPGRRAVPGRRPDQRIANSQCRVVVVDAKPFAVPIRRYVVRANI